VKAIADELNLSIGAAMGLRLDVVHWLNHSWPNVGSDSQDVINRQIGEYDIFIGILWKRIGSPTKRNVSGTLEEFKIAYEMWQKKPEMQIMMYFNQEPFYPSLTEVHSIQQILEFKQELKGKGLLYCEYHGQIEFERELRQHLSLIITKGLPTSKDSRYEKLAKNVLSNIEPIHSVALYATEVLTEQSTVALLYMDIDNFTRVNGSAGVHAANSLLHRITTTLIKRIGTPGKLFRISGDEFAIVSIGSNIEEALALATESKNQIEEIGKEYRIEEKGKEYRITASFGVALADGSRIPVSQAISEVRKATLASKLRGKNCITACPLSADDRILLEGRNWYES
jgi:diguanylate cyclase (GGDEF)-like protein